MVSEEKGSVKVFGIPYRFQEVWRIVGEFGSRPFTGTELTERGFDPRLVIGAMNAFRTRGLVERCGKTDVGGYKVTVWKVRRWIRFYGEDGMSDDIDHPDYYGGPSNPYETIKVIEAWGLDFCLGNAVKYISRAGKKDRDTEVQDLKKAMWYIHRRIDQLENDRRYGR